jgi:ribosome small subunit-dependent GTPase A
MTSSDETHKRSSASSHRKQMKKVRSREEQRLLDENSKRRGLGRKKKPRQHAWNDSEEDEFSTSFEGMRPAAQLDLTRAKDEAQLRRLEVLSDVDESLLETIVSVARDRVCVSSGAHARTILLDENSPQVAVGDRALIDERDAGQERLVGIAPRRSVLSRPDPGNGHRELVLAANVDVTVIVASTAQPLFRPGLVDRFLITIQRGGITPVLVVNKMDLLESDESAQALEAALKPYVDMGIEVFRISAESGAGLSNLRERLASETCVLVGHSGVGKSTILNGIDSQRERNTGGGREFDGKGRHTTTSSELTFLEGGTRLIDTPGIRSLGLWQITPTELAQYFPEFEEVALSCRFRDCSHLVEPDCGVRLALDAEKISAARYQVYARLYSELS